MTSIENEIRALAPGLQLMSVATLTDRGGPRVRYVAGRIGTDLTLRFSTYLSSDKIRQIRADPRVHVTLGATDFHAKQWLQVDGEATISTAEAERKAFWFEGLKAYISGIDDPDYCVVIVHPTRIEIASMDNPPLVWTPKPDGAAAGRAAEG